MFGKPLFHSLMWVAILHAKKIGCKLFEVGEQKYPNHSKITISELYEIIPSKKDLHISEFKAGFGGDIWMFIDLKIDSKLKTCFGLFVIILSTINSKFNFNCSNDRNVITVLFFISMLSFIISHC